MRRLIFTVWSAFSLLVLLVAAAMWVRSYYWWDSAAWPTGTSNALSVSSQFGGINILESYYVPHSRYFGFRPERPTKLGMSSFRCDPYRSYWRLDTANAILGFYYDYLPTLYRRLLIPYWAITLVFAVCPIAWVLTCRRRHKVGCCIQCGYDLRATRDQCPECGMLARRPPVIASR